MAWVKYPFHVKANGKYFNPGEAIEVDDISTAVAQGAKVTEKRKSAKRQQRPEAHKTE